MKLETTAEEQYVAELIKDRGHYPKLARRMFDERNTLLARNDELWKKVGLAADEVVALKKRNEELERKVAALVRELREDGHSGKDDGEWTECSGCSALADIEGEGE